MTDTNPGDPTKADAADAAKKSEEAGIADESAAYTDAIGKTQAPAADEAEGHPS